MEKRWAQVPAARHQQILLPQSLDDAVAPGHPIRTLESCLLELDWQAWEARYDGHRGQPPIHPMRLAGTILYGLMRGARTSRELEDATRERLDFRWFLEGRTVDHSTFADFRVRFGAELKGLFRQIARQVCEREERSVLERDFCPHKERHGHPKISVAGAGKSEDRMELGMRRLQPQAADKYTGPSITTKKGKKPPPNLQKQPMLLAKKTPMLLYGKKYNLYSMCQNIKRQAL